MACGPSPSWLKNYPVKTGFFIATFNLPNCNYYNPYHDPNVALGHYHSGYVPNITGSIVSVGGNLRSGNETVSGALYVSTANNAAAGGNNRGYNGIYFDASRASDAYWNSRTVLAAGINMYWCIKY